MTLAELLAAHPHLLLDFDGPMCAVFTTVSSDGVTTQLRRKLLDRGVLLPSPAVADDPFALLYQVRDSAPAMLAFAEHTLSDLERSAVRGAYPTPYLGDMLGYFHRAGRTVTIVSNNSLDAVIDFVQAHTLGEYLTGIVARTEPDPSLLKPNPYLIRQAATSLGVHPDACILLGDSVTDMQAARAAGSASIAYANKPGKATKLAAARPDSLVHSLAEVAKAIVEVGAR